LDKKSAEFCCFVVIFILLQKKLPKTRNAADMGMIPQETKEMQESVANVLRGIPAALSSGGRSIYILIKDIDKELEGFLSTGRTDAAVFSTLPLEDMKAMAECCEHYSLTLVYRSQSMEST
jgi:hypothetical protein